MNQPISQPAVADDRLKPSEYIGYALGDTASNFFFQSFNIFLTYYYVDVWGIPATVLLWLIPLVRAFGAFDDVIMGLIADRTNTRWGKFRPYLLFGAEEATYLKAERHLLQTGGIVVSARQIQRVVQRVGSAAQQWQERPAQPGSCDASVMYVSGDGTGVPMVAEELKGRRGKQADGKAKTCQVYLGCVFTQHKTDEKGHPVRDWESTTYISSFKSIDEFGPALRQEAIRRGMGTAGKIVLLIDGAAGLENMGKSSTSKTTASGSSIFITRWNPPAKSWRP